MWCNLQTCFPPPFSGQRRITWCYGNQFWTSAHAKEKEGRLHIWQNHRRGLLLNSESVRSRKVVTPGFKSLGAFPSCLSLQVVLATEKTSKHQYASELLWYWLVSRTISHKVPPIKVLWSMVLTCPLKCRATRPNSFLVCLSKARTLISSNKFSLNEFMFTRHFCGGTCPWGIPLNNLVFGEVVTQEKSAHMWRQSYFKEVTRHHKTQPVGLFYIMSAKNPLLHVEYSMCYYETKLFGSPEIDE